MGYPRMLEVRQRFDAPRVGDVAGTVAPRRFWTVRSAVSAAPPRSPNVNPRRNE